MSQRGFEVLFVAGGRGCCWTENVLCKNRVSGPLSADMALDGRRHEAGLCLAEGWPELPEHVRQGAPAAAVLFTPAILRYKTRPR